MKKIWKRCMVVALFLCFVTGALYRANEVFRIKGDSAGYPMEMFYEQKEDTVDVLNIGNSHMFANVNPAILWDEYGMASYNLGAGLQPPWNTYYYLKEALKYQTPDLIVMDVFGVTQTADYLAPDRTAMNTLGLKWGEEYEGNIEVSVESAEEHPDYWFKFPIYHNRYAGLTEADFREYGGDSNAENYKGYALNCISTTIFGGFVDVESVIDQKEMLPKCEEYLLKTIELAQSAQIPILLTVNPYAGVTYEEKKVYNRVEELAAELGVDYIDFNEYCEEIGFDFANDFAEAHHLNYYGAEKFSRYYGAYLKEHYEIPDRRGQEGFETWEENSRFYEKQAANIDLQKTQDETVYLEKLFANKDRYTICMIFEGNYYNESRAYIYGLADQGLDVWNEHCWVIESGEILYHADKRVELPFFYKDLGKCAAAVDQGKIFLGEREGKLVWDGLNILVYDNELETFVDACGIDAADGNLVR